MTDKMFCTEAEVKQIIIDVVSLTDEAPTVFIAYREQSTKSFNRQVTFVIQTREGNEELINNLNKASITHERQLSFIKSDLNVQSGNFEIDYLYVIADIYPQLA